MANKINLYDKVALKPTSYNLKLLNRTCNRPEDKVLLLVIRVMPKQLLVRYPDGVVVEIDKSDVLLNQVISPAQPEYWEDMTPAIQKQMLYDSAYKQLCSSYGINYIPDTPQHNIVLPKESTRQTTPSYDILIKQIEERIHSLSEHVGEEVEVLQLLLDKLTRLVK